MTNQVRIITVQFAVDVDNDVEQRQDELIGELRRLESESEVGLRFKRYSVRGPHDEEYFFEPGMF